MTPTPYLFFNGTCRDAMAFYASIFGGSPELMDASGMPPEFPVPEDRKNWIMHASLPVGNGSIMASDNVMGESDPMAGCSVQLNYPTTAEARDVFDKLAEGGETTMPFEPTFWTAGFGMLVDRFGIRWMVNSDEPPAK